MRQIINSQISSSSSNANSVLTVDSNTNVVFRFVAPTYALDDISPQFDGTKTVFDLTVDLANISTVINSSIVDSKDLDVAINGMMRTPYVTQLTWPWITPYDAFKGYRIVGDKIIFYSAPSPGSLCTMTLRNTSLTAQTRRYPYTTSSIALGD